MLNDKDLFDNDSDESGSESSEEEEEEEETITTVSGNNPSSWDSDKLRASIRERLEGHGLASLLDSVETDSDDEEGEVSSESDDDQPRKRRAKRKGRKKAGRRFRNGTTKPSVSREQSTQSFGSMPELASCHGSVNDQDTMTDDGSYAGSVRDFLASRILTATQSHSSGTWLGNGWEDGLESVLGMDDDTIYTTLTKQGVIIEGIPAPEPVKGMGGNTGFDVNLAVNHLTKCAQAAGINQEDVVNILERLIAEHDAKATKDAEARKAQGEAAKEIKLDSQSEIQFSPAPKEFEVSKPVEYEVQRPTVMNILPGSQQGSRQGSKQGKVALSIDGTAETSPTSRPESSESVGMDDSDEWNADPASLLKVAAPGATPPSEDVKEQGVEEENASFVAANEEAHSIVSMPKQETASIVSRPEEEGVEMSHEDSLIPSNPPYAPKPSEPSTPSTAAPSTPSSPGSPVPLTTQQTMPVPRQMMDPVVPDKPRSVFSLLFGCFSSKKR